MQNKHVIEQLVADFVRGSVYIAPILLAVEKHGILHELCETISEQAEKAKLCIQNLQPYLEKHVILIGTKALVGNIHSYIGIQPLETIKVEPIIDSSGAWTELLGEWWFCPFVERYYHLDNMLRVWTAPNYTLTWGNWIPVADAETLEAAKTFVEKSYGHERDA